MMTEESLSQSKRDHDAMFGELKVRLDELMPLLGDSSRLLRELMPLFEECSRLLRTEELRPDDRT